MRGRHPIPRRTGGRISCRTIMPVKKTDRRTSVARALLESPDRPHWGYPMAASLGMQRPVLYKILQWMVDLEWLTTDRESGRSLKGHPPRRYYRLTDKGLSEIPAFLAGEGGIEGRVCQAPKCSAAIRATAQASARFCSPACCERARFYAARAAAGRPVAPPAPRMNTLPCSIDGCDRVARAKGMCARHSHNAAYYGNPIPQRDRPLDVRLRETGWTVTRTGCWEWNGKRNEHGYGIFNAKRLGLNDVRVHRLTYKVLFGHALGDDQELRHKCDNPPCMNPRHLAPGTHADNMQDMISRGRHEMQKRSACRKGHDLTLPGALMAYKSVKAGCTQCYLNRKAREPDQQRARRAAKCAS